MSHCWADNHSLPFYSVIYLFLLLVVGKHFKREQSELLFHLYKLFQFGKEFHFFDCLLACGEMLMSHKKTKEKKKRKKKKEFLLINCSALHCLKLDWRISFLSILKGEYHIVQPNL